MAFEFITGTSPASAEETDPDIIASLLFNNNEELFKLRESYFVSLRDKLASSNRHALEAVKASLNESLVQAKEGIKALKPIQDLPAGLLRNNEKAEPSNKLTKIEEDIRRAKLKEVTKIKQELEEKLSALNENVELLKQGNTMIHTPKKNTSFTENESEFVRRKEEAVAFIRKMKLEKIERRKKEEERMRLFSEKLKKEAEQREIEQKQREIELLQKRKEASERAYLLLKQKREEDRKKFQEWERIGTAPKEPAGYLYKKLEDKYKHEILVPLLEEKKQELAKRRNKFKPFKWEEIKVHEKECEKKAQEHSEERARYLLERKIQERKLLVKQKMMRNEISLKYSLLEQKAKEEEERRQQEKKLLKDKMKNYAALVKEVVTVKQSPEKAAELKTKISHLKHPVRQQRDIRKLYDLSLLNQRDNDTLKEKRSQSMVHSETSKKPNENEESIVGSNLKKVRTTSKVKRSVPNKLKNALQKAIEINDTNKKKPLPDYLAEQRKKREQENVSLDVQRKQDWEKDLRNPGLDVAEKYNRVVGKANQIEQKAKMKEKLLHAKGGAEKDLEMGENVTDMFIDAIKAKLAILEQFQYEDPQTIQQAYYCIIRNLLVIITEQLLIRKYAFGCQFLSDSLKICWVWIPIMGCST
eukprot:TRINITY_DN2519_c0_g1_i1.p1 TRINITY_DN2519_c0_g1~~TRINITY_DN2519_c0_g1_i1.p1  ORF type:complete len:675 (-),score=118.88 TRINITY_DN2519_c0_g1_i1:1107-3035(-)